MTSFVPLSENESKESGKIVETLTVSKRYLWTVGDEPLNEFNTPCLSTMAFTTLFADGLADPTANINIRNVASSANESFASKLKRLIRFAEKENGLWIFRFAAHPRFVFS